ncbi:hypothetical protein BHE90_005625 [Fusarium euwallaceae]|uniref:Uncharacterized protein n=1 Tax=Fusarium euwallaceae TaxID=1147111 RepID=A0A430LVY5_9HYPO|nr:hypothetical protein BHE90_005625 [Fusarium euwallaceae]
MEGLQLPHLAPSSFDATHHSHPTPRSWFAWLPPLPRKPVWPPWECPWTLSCILLWASIGAFISYHYQTSQQPQQAKVTIIPLVPLLEEATMAASIGIMVIGSPLYHFIRPTLPSKPGELPALQNSEIDPQLLWDGIGMQVAGCKGLSTVWPSRSSTPEQRRLFNISSRYLLVHNELFDKMNKIRRATYRPQSKLPPGAFFDVVPPVGQIQAALNTLDMAEWKNGEDEFQRQLIQIQYAYIGRIVHDMVLAMEQHIQPIKDIIEGFEESIGVLDECSQFIQNRSDFHDPYSPEDEMDIQRNQRYAYHTDYTIKAWKFGLENLEVASTYIRALSVEMEKVISGQASIGPLGDLVIDVGALHAKLARGAMAHHQQMIEFHKQAEARECDDVTDQSEGMTPELRRRLDALGKPFLMPMWVWCRQEKSNCYYYWL